MNFNDYEKYFSAEDYNKLLIDHHATDRAQELGLKSSHFPNLIKILKAHELADKIELHLLHRHFELNAGEIILHRTLTIHTSSGEEFVDVARAINASPNNTRRPTPIMWMVSENNELSSYEYASQEGDSIHEKGSCSISGKQWGAFSQEFCEYVCQHGLQEVVSLKDKSCVTGGEYIGQAKRILLRIPYSLIDLQPESSLVESGWTERASSSQHESDPLPECTDGHVTKTRQTTGGTVAHYHQTVDAPEAFDPKEVAPDCSRQIWKALDSETFFNLDIITV